MVENRISAYFGIRIENPRRTSGNSDDLCDLFHDRNVNGGSFQRDRVYDAHAYCCNHGLLIFVQRSLIDVK